jgi:hypothetical protein
MALEKEVWTVDIADNLYPANEAYQQSIDDSSYLQNGVVHTPIAGTQPRAVKNPSVFPLIITERVDVDATYNVDTYATLPVLLPDDETIELSYDKRQSLLSDHVNALNTEIADDMYLTWAAANGNTNANIVTTTGATARNVYKTGQTGTRKPIVRGDVEEVARIMDRMEVPNDGGRILLVDSDMLKDLRLIDQYLNADYMNRMGLDLANGQAGSILGFRIYIRSRVVAYTKTTFLKKKPVDGLAADDSLACLAFHRSFVRKAMGNRENGEIKVFIDEDSPLYLGSILNAKTRAGGRAKYNDQKGIVSLVETWVS